MKTPDERIQLIQQSLRCFVLGWWSFVPLIGIVTSIWAIILHRRVRFATGSDWNPAQKYSRCGVICAWIGLTLSMIALAAIGVGIFIASLSKGDELM